MQSAGSSIPQLRERPRGGSGHIHRVGVLAALDEVGYAGQVVIEAFTPESAEIARAVSLWRPLATSPDELATNGPAFLRRSSPRLEAQGFR